jgi:FkbM family methyltransferase
MFHCANGEDRTIEELLNYSFDGFYIDVGAHSPFHESVTRYFYEERNFRGINIEPQKHYYDQLCMYRPEDINLNLACGATKGVLQLYLGDGLTTAVDKYAHTDWSTIEVPMVPLVTICDDYIQNKTIDFLKIDCEGFEKDVLLGMDFTVCRPKLLAIEATVPMSEIDVSYEWEYIVLNSGYELVRKDRVNRYYKTK